MADRTIRGAALDWRKSSASGEDNECVEVAATEESVLVRDSRDPVGMLVLNSVQWRELLGRILNGDLGSR